ncbi:OmpA family protein [Myxococcus stipitatus]|uniref:OmpA/MotB family protein n=1 Tax=Myxococcus stipitatus TaxID=83455 RepID=UPI001F4875F0|nr:OmpA family protein [Myxococcus stipitatus]MCE9668836.1 OmpA family protein [Myxococcus stipitatus]
MVRSKRGWKALIGASALLVAGGASAKEPKELTEARSAYKELIGSKQGRERPREVSDARAALKKAEEAYRRDEDSQKVRVLSYVALRKAETAAALGDADLASRELARAQSQLAQAQALQQQASRMRQQGMAQQEEWSRQQQAGQQQLSEESARRQQLEAEAQRLAAENQALQQRTAELEAERKTSEEADRKASEALSKLEQANQDLKVREEERGTVLTLSGSVLFASGKSELLPIARQRLTDVAEVLKQTDNPLLIEGHTDSQGSDQLNETLSYQRAERVKDYLMDRGIPANRIQVRGLGEYQPVASNHTPEGRANNRRVEIIVERESRAVGGSGERQGTSGGAHHGTGSNPSGTGGAGQEQPSGSSSGTGGGGHEQQPGSSSDTSSHQGSQPSGSDDTSPR